MHCVHTHTHTLSTHDGHWPRSSTQLNKQTDGSQCKGQLDIDLMNITEGQLANYIDQFYVHTIYYLPVFCTTYANLEWISFIKIRRIYFILGNYRMKTERIHSFIHRNHIYISIHRMHLHRALHTHVCVYANAASVNFRIYSKSKCCLICKQNRETKTYSNFIHHIF